MAPKAKPELTYFGLALRRIMKNMGYDFEYPRGFFGGKGITIPLKPYLRPRGRKGSIIDVSLPLFSCSSGWFTNQETNKLQQSKCILPVG